MKVPCNSGFQSSTVITPKNHSTNKLRDYGFSESPIRAHDKCSSLNRIQNSMTETLSQSSIKNGLSSRYLLKQQLTQVSTPEMNNIMENDDQVKRERSLSGSYSSKFTPPSQNFDSNQHAFKQLQLSQVKTRGMNENRESLKVMHQMTSNDSTSSVRMLR